MILVGENLNIMSKTLGPALRERNIGPVQEMAVAEHKVDVDYIDINIGPARKGGDMFMSWVVNAVQQVTNRPLSLDTTNPEAMEAGLKACRSHALINSISLQPDRLNQELPLVQKYNADMIGLLWGVEGMPRDANERCMLAVDLVYKANEKGIPNEKIWIDPIATPVCGEINQLKASFEFLKHVAGNRSRMQVNRWTVQCLQRSSKRIKTDAKSNVHDDAHEMRPVRCHCGCF